MVVTMKYLGYSARISAERYSATRIHIGFKCTEFWIELLSIFLTFVWIKIWLKSCLSDCWKSIRLFHCPIHCYDSFHHFTATAKSIYNLIRSYRALSFQLNANSNIRNLKPQSAAHAPRTWLTHAIGSRHLVLL